MAVSGHGFVCFFALNAPKEPRLVTMQFFSNHGHKLVSLRAEDILQLIVLDRKESEMTSQMESFLRIAI